MRAYPWWHRYGDDALRLYADGATLAGLRRWLAERGVQCSIGGLHECLRRHGAAQRYRVPKVERPKVKIPRRLSDAQLFSKARNRAVCDLLSYGVRQAEVARRFGISRQRVWQLAKEAAKRYAVAPCQDVSQQPLSDANSSATASAPPSLPSA